MLSCISSDNGTCIRPDYYYCLVWLNFPSCPPASRAHGGAVPLDTSRGKRWTLFSPPPDNKNKAKPSQITAAASPFIARHLSHVWGGTVSSGTASADSDGSKAPMRDVAARMPAQCVCRLLLLVWMCAVWEALSKSLPDLTVGKLATRGAAAQ